MASDLIRAINLFYTRGVAVCIFLVALALGMFAVLFIGQVICNGIERFRERREEDAVD